MSHDHDWSEYDCGPMNSGLSLDLNSLLPPITPSVLSAPMGWKPLYTTGINFVEPKTTLRESSCYQYDVDILHPLDLEAPMAKKPKMDPAQQNIDHGEPATKLRKKMMVYLLNKLAAKQEKWTWIGTDYVNRFWTKVELAAVNPQLELEVPLTEIKGNEGSNEIYVAIVKASGRINTTETQPDDIKEFLSEGDDIFGQYGGP